MAEKSLPHVQKPTRVPIKIDTDTYTTMKTYAELRGETLTAVLSEAIKDWAETCGQARIECYAEMGRGEKPQEEKSLDSSGDLIIVAQA